MALTTASWARPARILNLAGACVLNWGADVIYTLPATLSVPLRDHLRLSEAQFEFLISAVYTAFAIPNIFLPFCTGPLVTRFGQRNVLIGTSACMVLGQVIFSWAVAQRQIWIIALGRVIYGLGGEITGVITNDLVTRWFEHSNLALALAMLHDASRLGGATTSLATPRLLVHSVPFATNILTLVSTIPLILSCASLSIVISPSSRSPSNLVTPLTNSLRTPNLIQTGIITSILSLPTRFWAFAHVSVTLYAAIAGFHVVAQRHVAATFYDGSDVAAGTALSVMPLLSVLFVPFFGHLLSKPWASVPRAAMLSCACLLLGHTLMIVRALGAVVPLVMLGFGGAGFGAVFGLGIAQSVGRGSKKVVDMNGGAYSRVLDHDDDVGAAEYVDVSADANLHADDDLRDSVSSSMLMSTLSTSTATHEPEDRISSSDANNIVTVAFGAGVGLLNASGALVPLLVAPLEASTDHTAVGSFAAVQIFLAGIAGMACVLCVRLERVWGRA